jgi:hypothetical protein
MAAQGRDRVEDRLHGRVLSGGRLDGRRGELSERDRLPNASGRNVTQAVPESLAALKSKAGKRFDARLKLEEDAVRFDFEP